METILKIRRLYHHEKLSVREIAKRLRLNRRTVKKYLTTLEPPTYQRKSYHYPKLGSFLPYLEAFLNQEQDKPAKERLSVRRLFELLRSEGYQGQYNSLACFVRRFKAQYEPKIQDVFIPQYFPEADAYQFDWSTEAVKLSGELVKINVAHFRLCHSRAFFIKAYPNQRMDMLVDAHNCAFEFLGGTCKRGIYDNMKTAVTSIGIGKERVFNEQFLAMMNHFLIEPVACTPASGWEKGQVERQVKTLRKRIFEPMLSFTDLEELNSYLRAQCCMLMDEFKHPDDKTITVSQALKKEQNLLIQITPYYWYKDKPIHVNRLSLICYENHRYSVPCHLVGKVVNLQAQAEQIHIIYQNECIASHKRSFIKNHTTYNPWHYLDILRYKPGALRNGDPFAHWDLPEPILQLQNYLMDKPKGDRTMVELLVLIRDYGEDIGITAASIALEKKIVTVEAVQHIINQFLEPNVPKLKAKEIPLSNPPQSNCQRYDSLLTGVRHAAS